MRMRPVRIEGTRVSLAIAAAALCLLAGGGTVCAAPAPPAVADAPAGESPRSLVFFVRHAEKSTDDPRDPSLSAEGEARSEALARMLSGAGVTHLFSSEYRRTRDTLAPLAERIGRKVREIPAADPEAQIAAIRELPAGSIAVVAGHSNTVPRLVEMLGGKVSGLVDTAHGAMIADDTYDRMFLLVLPSAGAGASVVDRAQTVELRYGD